MTFNQLVHLGNDNKNDGREMHIQLKRLKTQNYWISFTEFGCDSRHKCVDSPQYFANVSCAGPETFFHSATESTMFVFRSYPDVLWKSTFFLHADSKSLFTQHRHVNSITIKIKFQCLCKDQHFTAVTTHSVLLKTNLSITKYEMIYYCTETNIENSFPGKQHFTCCNRKV